MSQEDPYYQTGQTAEADVQYTLPAEVEHPIDYAKPQAVVAEEPTNEPLSQRPPQPASSGTYSKNFPLQAKLVAPLQSHPALLDGNERIETFQPIHSVQSPLHHVRTDEQTLQDPRSNGGVSSGVAKIAKEQIGEQRTDDGQPRRGVDPQYCGVSYVQTNPFTTNQYSLTMSHRGGVDESKSGGTDNTKFIPGLYSKFYYTNTYTNTQDDYKHQSSDNLLGQGSAGEEEQKISQQPFNLEQTSEFSNLKQKPGLNKDSDPSESQLAGTQRSEELAARRERNDFQEDQLEVRRKSANYPGVASNDQHMLIQARAVIHEERGGHKFEVSNPPDEEKELPIKNKRSSSSHAAMHKFNPNHTEDDSASPQQMHSMPSAPGDLQQFAVVHKSRGDSVGIETRKRDGSGSRQGTSQNSYKRKLSIQNQRQSRGNSRNGSQLTSQQERGRNQSSRQGQGELPRNFDSFKKRESARNSSRRSKRQQERREDFQENHSPPSREQFEGNRRLGEQELNLILSSNDASDQIISGLTSSQLAAINLLQTEIKNGTHLDPAQQQLLHPYIVNSFQSQPLGERATGLSFHRQPHHQVHQVQQRPIELGDIGNTISPVIEAVDSSQQLLMNNQNTLEGDFMYTDSTHNHQVLQRSFKTQPMGIATMAGQAGFFTQGANASSQQQTSWDPREQSSIVPLQPTFQQQQLGESYVATPLHDDRNSEFKIQAAQQYLNQRLGGKSSEMEDDDSRLQALQQEIQANMEDIHKLEDRLQLNKILKEADLQTQSPEKFEHLLLQQLAGTNDGKSGYSPKTSQEHLTSASLPLQLDTILLQHQKAPGSIISQQALLQRQQQVAPSDAITRATRSQSPHDIPERQGGRKSRERATSNPSGATSSAKFHAIGNPITEELSKIQSIQHFQRPSLMGEDQRDLVEKYKGLLEACQQQLRERIALAQQQEATHEGEARLAREAKDHSTRLLEEQKKKTRVYKDRAHDYKELLKKKDAQIKNLKEQVDLKVQRFIEAQKETEALAKSKTEMEHKRALSDQAEKIKSETQELSSKVEQLQKQVDLQKDIINLKEIEITQKQETINANTRMYQQNIENEARRITEEFERQLQEKESALQQAMAELEATGGELNSLRVTFEEGKVKFRELQMELQDSVAKADGLEVENKELAEDVERLQKIAGGLQTLNEDFRSLEFSQKRELDDLHRKYKFEISGLNERIDRLEADSRLSSQQIDQLKHLNEQLNASIEEGKEKTRAKQKDLDNKQSDLIDLQRKFHKLKTTSSAELESAKQNFEKHIAKFEKEMAQRESIENELVEKAEQILKLEQLVDDLREDTQGATQLLSGAKNSTYSLDQELVKATKKNQKLVMENNRLKNQIQRLDVKIQQLSHRLLAAEAKKK